MFMIKLHTLILYTFNIWKYFSYDRNESYVENLIDNVIVPIGFGLIMCMIIFSAIFLFICFIVKIFLILKEKYRSIKQCEHYKTKLILI